jgi:methanogenesis imperfect marker protein 11
MIVKKPEEVKTKFGSLFSRRFLVMVDKGAGLAEIIEQCHARGPIEWDAMNRIRAKGATVSARVEGTEMRMLARLGLFQANFGAAGDNIGGQALEGVEVQGDEVVTSWAGIAGAGLGIAACLPQAPGVTRAEYPTEEDLVVGGARVNRVRIFSPLYEKVTIGIDDTDTSEKGATWVLALKCGEQCQVEGAEFLNMRLIQLNPMVPEKTTNCVGSALNFAVKPGSVDALLAYVRDYIEEFSFSDDTGIAYYRGLEFPKIMNGACRRIKTEIVTLRDAEDIAASAGIRYIDTAGRKGRIGALGSVLWANRGIEAAGLYGEPS